MSNLTANLIGLGVIAALIPFGVILIRWAGRNRVMFTPMAAMMIMILGFIGDPPPPPRAESIRKDENQGESGDDNET